MAAAWQLVGCHHWRGCCKWRWLASKQQHPQHLLLLWMQAVMLRLLLSLALQEL
jgi:hypothetical protein